MRRTDKISKIIDHNYCSPDERLAVKVADGKKETLEKVEGVHYIKSIYALLSLVQSQAGLPNIVLYYHIVGRGHHLLVLEVQK